MCQGCYLSDVKGVGRFPYYEGEEESRSLYHVEMICIEKAIKNGLCALCIKRETKLQTYVLSPKFVLKVSLNGVAASHHNIFHRRIGEPIPLWSHAAGGIWDKEMEQKGYSKIMVKFVVDEKILEFVRKLEGIIPQKIKKIMTEHAITKAEALRYIKYCQLNGNNPAIVVSREKEEAFDVVEVHVKKIEVAGKPYLYEPMKSKVYTLEYEYVGRYDSKEKRIFTEYPDSDAEPVLN